MSALRQLVRGEVAWSRLLLGALIVTVCVAVLALAATSTAAFGLYNPAWDGTSDFRDDIEADPGVELEIVQDTEQYDELAPNETVAFVIAPDDAYEEADAERVRRFVDDGGTLVVLENFGSSGDELLVDVSASARFDGQLLRDERNYFRGPAMPVATDVEAHNLTAGVEQLTLNYATGVDPGEATVLVRTSSYAYLGPADADLEEVGLDTYPVATTESVGEGEVIAVGDPSITINAMYAEPDNAAFLANLYGDRDRVVHDISHAEDLPPLTAAMLTIRGSPPIQFVLGLLLVGTVGALASRRVGPAIDGLVEKWIRNPSRPVGRTRTPVESPTAHDTTATAAGNLGFSTTDPDLSTAERAEFLRRRYPDWDDERIQRLITALNRPRSKGDGE